MNGAEMDDLDEAGGRYGIMQSILTAMVIGG